MSTFVTAPDLIKCLPSPVDENESMTESGLTIVRNPTQIEPVKRGVIVDMGSRVQDDIWTFKLNDVLFYTSARTIGEYEFVVCRWEHIIGWETDDS